MSETGAGRLGSRPGRIRWLDRALEVAVGATLAAMSLAILLQVAMRYVFNAPLPWPEEFAVLAFAWLIFMGAARVQRDDGHLSIDMARRAAGPRGRAALDLLRLTVIAGCGLVLIVQGASLAGRTGRLLYPAMEIPRSMLYGAVPLSFAVGLVYVARHAWRIVHGASEP